MCNFSISAVVEINGKSVMEHCKQYTEMLYILNSTVQVNQNHPVKA